MIIKKVLQDNFPEINNYSEEEALSKPYFLVKVLNSNEAKELNKRYKRSVSFEINYVSDNQNINEDYLNKVDLLYEVLETIEIEGKKYKALNMNHEVKDKILSFMFQLKLNLLKNTEETSMTELEVDVGGK